MTQPQPPTFVISLSGETARRARIEKILGKINLPFTFVDAVDGRAFDVLNHPLYDGPRRLRNFGRHMNGGEIGCLMSHRKICQMMVDDNMPLALVFEDDIILRDGFLDVVKQLVAMENKFDMIRFFGSPKLERLKMRAIGTINGPHKLTRHSGMPGGTHAALLTLNGAKKILAATQKNAFPIDAILGRSWETKINWYTIRPGLAAQDLSFDSAIGDARFDKQKDVSGLTKLVFPFTRAWFKFCETLGKKYWYYKNYLNDKKITKTLKETSHG